MFNKEAILAYLTDGNSLKTVRVRIQSLRKDKDGEFALLSNGERIGLDQIRSINGISI